MGPQQVPLSVASLSFVCVEVVKRSTPHALRVCVCSTCTNGFVDSVAMLVVLFMSSRTVFTFCAELYAVVQLYTFRITLVQHFLQGGCSYGIVLGLR